MEKFLFFYKAFVWKNKEVTELLDLKGEFFKAKFMKVPTIYTVEDEIKDQLNNDLQKKEEGVENQRKIMFAMKKEDLTKLTEASLGLTESQLFDDD